MKSKQVSEKAPLTAKALFIQERDDLPRLPVPKETKTYARMTSASVMHQPGGTSDKWRKSLNLRKAITNQKNVKGFANKDAAGKIPNTFQKAHRAESAESLVKKLLD
jgi:hypothetical protein